MALRCPECRETINATNINVQEMVAVCEHCNHVFNFSGKIPLRKEKRRKVKRPEKIQSLEDDNNVELNYRSPLLWGGSGIIAMFFSGAVLFTFAWFISGGFQLSGPDTPNLLKLIFYFLMVSCWYGLAAFLAVKTSVITNTEAIIKRTWSPLLPLLSLENTALDWDNITDVFCEETEESQKAESLDKHYHVYVQFTNNKRAILLRSMPQHYAFYITQILEEYLHSAEETNTREGESEFSDEQHIESDSLRLIDFIDNEETGSQAK